MRAAALLPIEEDNGFVYGSAKVCEHCGVFVGYRAVSVKESQGDKHKILHKAKQTKAKGFRNGDQFQFVRWGYFASNDFVIAVTAHNLWVIVPTKRARLCVGLRREIIVRSGLIIRFSVNQDKEYYLSENPDFVQSAFISRDFQRLRGCYLPRKDLL